MNENIKILIEKTLFSLIKGSVSVILGLFVWNNLVSPFVSYCLGLNFPKLELISWILYFSLTAFPLTILRDKNKKKKNSSPKEDLFEVFVPVVLSFYPSFLVWNQILIPVSLKSFGVQFPTLSFSEYMAFSFITLITYLTIIFTTVGIVSFIYLSLKNKIKAQKGL